MDRLLVIDNEEQLAMADINRMLANMRKSGRLMDMKGKGDGGELAALNVLLDIQRRIGGQVYLSYMYPYQKNRSGKTYLSNIKLEDGRYVAYTEALGNRQYNDEVDLLYITPYRIFAIESQSCHATMELSDTWMLKNKEPVDQSPVTQAEKHARHLYHAIYEYLPDGNPRYIIPITCFAGRCKIVDNRRAGLRDKLPVCVLNNLRKVISDYNTPLEYNLDTEAIRERLRKIKVNVKKEL
jgi:hypothetical protein